MKKKILLQFIIILILGSLVSGCLPSVSDTVEQAKAATELALNPILPSETPTITPNPTRTPDPNSTETATPTAFQAPTLVENTGCKCLGQERC